MFEPQFAEMILNRTKHQTIRKKSRRQFVVGEEVTFRMWTGIPYRSKQKILAVGEVIRFCRVLLMHSRVSIFDGDQNGDSSDSVLTTTTQLNRFALLDGFISWPDMMRYFKKAKLFNKECTLTEWRFV